VAHTHTLTGPKVVITTSEAFRSKKIDSESEYSAESDRLYKIKIGSPEPKL
jgi:hypothetical protein